MGRGEMRKKSPLLFLPSLSLFLSLLSMQRCHSAAVTMLVLTLLPPSIRSLDLFPRSMPLFLQPPFAHYLAVMFCRLYMFYVQGRKKKSNAAMESDKTLKSLLVVQNYVYVDAIYKSPRLKIYRRNALARMSALSWRWTTAIPVAGAAEASLPM